MYNDIDLNLEVDNNNENSVNVENLVNVSFESLIFPSKNLPPCFYNGKISENLENIYNAYSSSDEENKLILFRSFIEDITISDRIATYHIKLQYWDLFDIPGSKKVLKYDKETILKLFYGINK